jgi:integration host factor subunit alpha
LSRATFEIIKASLERGEKVKISNFGNFAVRSRKQRKGRNPQTGAEIVIPARKGLTFKASPAVNKTINKIVADENGASPSVTETFERSHATR